MLLACECNTRRWKHPDRVSVRRLCNRRHLPNCTQLALVRHLWSRLPWKLRQVRPTLFLPQLVAQIPGAMLYITNGLTFLFFFLCYTLFLWFCNCSDSRLRICNGFANRVFSDCANSLILVSYDTSLNSIDTVPFIHRVCVTAGSSFGDTSDFWSQGFNATVVGSGPCFSVANRRQSLQIATLVLSLIWLFPRSLCVPV